MGNLLRRSSWRTLRFLSGIEDWLRRRFTSVGLLVLGGTAAGAIFGIDTRRNLGSQVFGLGLGLLIVAMVGTIRRPRGILAQRHLPRYATVGIPVRYQVTVTNNTTRTIANLFIQERIPDPRPDLATFVSTPAPWEHKVNFIDRVAGYPRWKWLIRQGRWAEDTPITTIPSLTAKAYTALELTLQPCRRGPLILKQLEVMRTDILGISWTRATVASQDKLLVLPRRYPLPPQHPLGRRRLQPGGVSLAASVGDSQEFIGLRNYRPGDSPRHIHWAAWARTGTPVVKEYQDEYFSRQALILDNFLPPKRREDFEAAVAVAASFVEPLQGGDSLLDLMFVADKAYTMTSGRNLLSSDALLEVLACVAPQTGDFSTLSQAVLQHAPLLSACLCVLLAWDTPRRNLVKQLRSLNLPVRVLIIGGTAEIELGPMADRPHDLRYLDPQQLAAGLANFGY